VPPSRTSAEACLASWPNAQPQFKEDTVEPSVPAREFSLKAYAVITWHNDPASLGLEPRPVGRRSQAPRTATLPIAPPGQATNTTKTD